jgi:hypothetical protein
MSPLLRKWGRGKAVETASSLQDLGRISPTLFINVEFLQASHPQEGTSPISASAPRQTQVCLAPA